MCLLQQLPVAVAQVVPEIQGLPPAEVLQDLMARPRQATTLDKTEPTNPVTVVAVVAVVADGEAVKAEPLLVETKAVMLDHMA
jgi:hypothetical protein